MVEAAVILAVITAADDPALALVAILENLETTIEGLTCCDACGCLCRPFEHCPSCHPELWPTP